MIVECVVLQEADYRTSIKMKRKHGNIKISSGITDIYYIDTWVPWENDGPSCRKLLTSLKHKNCI